MTAVVLALSSSLAWGVADFGAGLASRRLPVLTVLVVADAASLPLIAVVVALRGVPPPGTAPVVYAVLAGLVGTAGIAAFYRALAVGNMSVIAPISSTGAALPVVFGIATGDRPSALQGAGVALAMVGVALASREAAHAAEGVATPAGGRKATGVGLALVAALGFGGFFVGIDAASDADVWWAIFVQRASSLVIVLAAVTLVRPSLAVGPGMAVALAAIGILDLTSNALFALASTTGLISLVGLLGSLYPVVTVLLAASVLGERPAALQWAGVAAAIAGVGMISAG